MSKTLNIYILYHKKCAKFEKFNQVKRKDFGSTEQCISLFSVLNKAD